VKRIAFLVVAVGVLGVASYGRAATVEARASLRADVAEWSVVPSVGVVPSGRTRILVRNVGEQVHQLMVVRVSSFAAQLRLRGNRAVATPVGVPVSVQPGRTATLTVDLTRGSYLLVDNLPWHYWQGTSAAFSVR
jgi:uncharacterized cupredoxin-like copper-binding protein